MTHKPIAIVVTIGDTQFTRICETASEAIAAVFDLRKSLPAMSVTLPLETVINHIIALSNAETDQPWTNPDLYIGRYDLWEYEYVKRA